MISRLQASLFLILVIASVVMGGILFHMREKTHERMLAGQDTAPTRAPQVAASEDVRLYVASDDDNTLRPQAYSLPLPADPGARAKAILAKLLDIYAAPDALHQVPGGAASVAEVFLLPASAGSGDAAAHSSSGEELAVVNLKSSFAAGHPSGLETETLTVLSICDTLHANLPRVGEVRFLVDGKVRESLAGHADLTKTYLTSGANPADSVQP